MAVPQPQAPGSRRLAARLAVGTVAMAAAALAKPPAPPSPQPPPPRVAPAALAALLHVPSPDWRDQVIYFLMTDRFDDGDPRNNDQGAGEFDPTRHDRYSGGDLAGVLRRLDYIAGLGATAVWITPPVANQWWDPLVGYTGYHGYWARHFRRVDEHQGTLADMQRLSAALHRRGMFLVKDIVVNHTGNFFAWRGPWPPAGAPQDIAAEAARSWQGNPRARPGSAPQQHPFDLNDPRRARDRRAGVYHWTPDIADYGDRRQELTGQMSGLDDLNTDNPAVRRALRESFGWWITQAGVDAFRVDTAFYVSEDFFEDFLRARDPKAPGVLEVARRTGRQDFMVFGEGFGIDRPFSDTQARKIERYMTVPDGPRAGAPVLPGMLNFPLYGALGDVFARGHAPAELAHRITALPRLHARPHSMPTFVDNHDVDRFLAGGRPAALRQALAAMFTLPGIPVVYYGTEQGFTRQRAAMFAAGWGSGGRDHFDTTAPLYRHIAALAALRRGHRLFSRGLPEVLRAAGAAPGALAWRTADPEDPARQALVVFNTADTPVLLDALATGAAPGSLWQPAFADGAPAQPFAAGAGGQVTLVLPARSTQVWVTAAVAGPVVAATPADSGAAPAAVGMAAAGPLAGPAPPPPAVVLSVPSAAQASAAPCDLPPPAPARLSLSAPERTVFDGDFDLSGAVAPAAGDAVPRLVVDGDLTAAQALRTDACGRWRARVDTSAMVDPTVTHRAVAWSPDGPSDGRVSQAFEFRVEPRWVLRADLVDPAGDDTGPGGRYLYPADPTWGDNRQMDLRRVQAWTAGGALRLELGMHRVTRSWSPANGFDHVAFTVFIELPGEPGGVAMMPQQNATLPAGMVWHRRLRLHGWSNALFDSQGASATAEGTPVAAAARVEVDAATHTVRLTLPASALGRRANLDGARVVVTTWDYDGGYRALGPQPGSHSVGGGPPDGPKVMDDTPVIVIK
jgi:glycosidase